MGLLDGGLTGVFASVFSAVYLDGTLHRRTVADDGAGTLAETWADHGCKVQPDAATERMITTLGFTSKDILIRILAGTIDITPNTDDEITIATGPYAGRWSIASIPSDGAGTYFEFGGRAI